MLNPINNSHILVSVNVQMFPITNCLVTLVVLMLAMETHHKSVVQDTMEACMLLDCKCVGELNFYDKDILFQSHRWSIH